MREGLLPFTVASQDVLEERRHFQCARNPEYRPCFAGLGEDSLPAQACQRPGLQPLLKLAASRGIPIVTGLEMFVQQGARQFEIWTGKPAPESEMLRVVELELRRRG